MYKNYNHNLWTDRHAIHLEPEMMDKFSADDSLFAGQPSELQCAVADALDALPNPRYRQLLEGLYRRHLSPQLMAEEMEISLPNLYNLHRRALAALKKQIDCPLANEE